MCDDHLDDAMLMSLTITSADVEKLSHNKQKQVSHDIIYHFQLYFVCSMEFVLLLIVIIDVFSFIPAVE